MVTLRDGLKRHHLRHPTPSWYRQAIQKCFNADEIAALVAQLDPKDKLDLLLRTLPKETEIKGESGITVTFKLNGMRDGQAIQGTVHPALVEHDEDDVSS